MCPPMSGRASKVSDDERRWRAESDCRALQTAEEIRADRRRHMDAKTHARREVARLKKITSGGRGRARR